MAPPGPFLRAGRYVAVAWEFVGTIAAGAVVGWLLDQRVIPFATVANAVLGRMRKRVFNAATRRELLNRYREDIRRTEALIGRSLDGWLKDA